MSRTRHHRWTRTAPAAVVAALALVVSACGGGGNGGSGSSSNGSPASNESVRLTLWSWSPFIENRVELFEKAHPNISVKLVNAGSSTDEYTKFRAAIKAGSGAPDTIMLEFPYVPTFAQIKAIRNLSQYGADEVKGDYLPWYIDRTTFQGGIYGMPQDAGVMGLIYRADLLRKYGIEVPSTWSEFATAAEALHKAAPDTYLTSFPTDNIGWFLTIASQRGSHPFKVDGDTISIHLDDAPTLEVARYWDDLIAKGAVQPSTLATNDWFSAVNRGTYASWITASWGPSLLVSTAAKTIGKWRAAQMPQWSADDPVVPVWNGSTYAVPSQSKHPAQAAELAEWLTDDRQAVQQWTTKNLFTFPALNGVVDSKAFADTPLKFYGGQKARKVFVAGSRHVPGDYQSSPFEDYVVDQGDAILSKTLAEHGTIVDALHQLQAVVVKYASDQGFTVR